MKFAVPTNDRKTLAERSGRAIEFAIIDIDSTGTNSTSYLTNEHEHTHHNGDTHSNNDEEHGHDDLVALLEGIDVVVGRKFGPHFAKDFHNAGIKMKITKTIPIDDAVKEIFETFNNNPM